MIANTLQEVEAAFDKGFAYYKLCIDNTCLYNLIQKCHDEALEKYHAGDTVISIYVREIVPYETIPFLFNYFQGLRRIAKGQPHIF